MKKLTNLSIGTVVSILITACGVIGSNDSRFNHNGIDYDVVVSPYTGRIWLDRNLGAKRVCASYDDSKCFGDYYQWGRNADGHEKENSEITYKQESSVKHSSSKFVVEGSDSNFDWDWLEEYDDGYRQANWQATNGSSICPKGFRVPTIDELASELDEFDVSRIHNNQEAFKNFLKLPSAGYRGRFYDTHPFDGKVHGKEKSGALWSVTRGGFGPTSLYVSYGLKYADIGESEFGGPLIEGMNVRCIKEIEDNY